MRTVTRRRFLGLSAAALLNPSRWLRYPGDWDVETPQIVSVRQALEPAFAGRNMALDFRCINASHDEEFRIQFNAAALYPVASCFKAWLALYYYWYIPRDRWDDGPGSAVRSMAVSSNNRATGVVMADVAPFVPGLGNPIEKFNDFLRLRMGMSSGLHTWDWPDSPTVGFFDPRFAPSPERQVIVRGQPYRVDNVFTAADMAHGYDVLARGPVFSRIERVRAALLAALSLLSIPATDYRSPIEIIRPDGYIGKDGILPASDLPLGRVVNDAGILTVGTARYIVAFMSAGESESVARLVLAQVLDQMDSYEAQRENTS